MADFSGMESWLKPLLTFAIALVTGLTIWRIVYRRLERWAAASAASWDGAIVRRARAPVRVLIGVAALGIASTAAPAAVRAHPIIRHGGLLAVIMLMAWLADRLLAAGLEARPLAMSMSRATRVLVLTIVRVLLYSLTLLALLDTVGVSITPFLASLGVGSVAVALALQDTLSNFFAGVYVLIDKPVRPGDYVQIDDAQGTISHVGWRTTRLVTPALNTVVMPNSKLATSRVVNFDLPDCEMIATLELSVPHGSDLEQVERQTLDTARQTLARVPGAVPGAEPTVRFHEVADSGIRFTLGFRVRHVSEQALARHELIKALKRPAPPQRSAGP